MSQEDEVDETETRVYEKNRSFCTRLKGFAKFAMENEKKFISQKPKYLLPLEKEHKLSNKFWGRL